MTRSAIAVRGWIMAFVALSTASAAQKKPPCTATGDLEIVAFESKVFPVARRLRILLPISYQLTANRDRRYPVLYLNDGQDLFDVCTSLTQEEWRVDETVSELTANGKLPPLIVVGIDNAGKALRAREYLPYLDNTLSPPEPNPQGKLYPSFLLDEVVPYVESHYRVRTGAPNRVLGGSSYGAGIALYTVIQRPGSFGGLLLESPSIYAAGYALLKDAASVQKWPQRIFIGTGTVREPIEDVRKLQNFFQNGGFQDVRLQVAVQNGAGHSEKWWAQRLPGALQFLFSATGNP